MPPSVKLSCTTSACDKPACGRSASELPIFTISGRRATSPAFSTVTPVSGLRRIGFGVAVGTGVPVGTGVAGAALAGG
jgi:hypothetical protein